MRNLLLFCSGVNRDLLSRCPAEESNFIGMGGSVLFTSVLAFLSAFMFARCAFHVGTTPACGIGLTFSLGVFNLDRWLVATMRLAGSLKACLSAALPRLAFSLIFSLVISDTFVLTIYQAEIGNQLTHNQAEARRLMQSRQASDPLAHEIDALTDRETALRAEIKQRRAQRDAFYQSYLEEAEGTAGTGKVGKGPVFKEKGERLREAETEFQTYSRGAEDELSHVARQRGDIRARLQLELNGLQVSEQRADGLLAREEALNQLVSKSPALLFRRLLIEILIIALDCMPVLSKLMLAVSHRHAYEAVHEAEEEHVIQKARRRKEEAQADADMETALRREVFELRRDIELRKRKQLHQSLADAHARLSEAAIVNWEERENIHLISDPESYLPSS